jgi:glycosyltransferase involved in cell wall biosynthesis
MKISYALTVCNEHEELKRLLDFLVKNVRDGDEIVVQCDEENTTTEVLRVLNKCADRVKVIEFPLKGHFANFKNNLTKECSGDYIFQIDADEIPNEYLIENLGIMLEMNPEVDVYRVPRINTVEGLTQDHINRWGWNVNEKGWVNFSDHQWRIYKNDGKIKWINKVHEVLTGFEVMSQFPPEEEYCLYHPKTIEKQVKQNEYYNTL